MTRARMLPFLLAFAFGSPTALAMAEPATPDAKDPKGSKDAAAPDEATKEETSVASIPVLASTPGEIAAIQAELQRGVAGWRLKETSAAPYHAQVRMVRADLLSLDGSYGGLITDVLDRQATGLVDVRVGTPERDNSNFFGAQSGLARLEVPLAPASGFVRRKLWLALDGALRGASKAYAQKQSALERLAKPYEGPDYAPPKEPVVREAPPLPSTFERATLGKFVADLSGRFRDFPSIDNGDVHFQVLRTHESVISNDGLALQWAADRSVLAVVADTRAPDGMQLDHGLAIHFDGEVKVDDELQAVAEKLVDRVLRELDELAAAPMIEEEYDGPIYLEGPAAAQLLAATVATAASGVPAPYGDTGRIADLEPAWQKRLGKMVMPPFLDLVDDPGSDEFGSYSVDAEGVEAEPLTLVRSGTLRSLLMTRVPNEYKSGSNGRARMSPSLEVGPTISNLRLVSRRAGHSERAIYRELIARAREDGYEFAYVIELLRDGSVLGPVRRESAAAYAGTGKIDLPLPARVWRIDGTGKKTLVRGAILAPASTRVLRRVRAVGAENHTERMRIPVGSFGGFGSDIGMDGILTQTVDVQVTTPGLLIEGLELLVERGEHERAPTLVHPLRRQEPGIAKLSDGAKKIEAKASAAQADGTAGR